MENRAIGIFDSGIGGLTVLKQIKKILPYENIIYYGDSINAPYGNKPKAIILDLSNKIIKFLLTQDIKLIIIACNTISANCFYKLEQEFHEYTHIIEIISSGARAGVMSLSDKKNKLLGLIATNATVNSQAYERYIKAEDNKIKIFAKACPLLVDLAERGLFNTKIAYDTAQNYLNYFKQKDIDSLILGCTHFPLFTNIIKKILPNVKIIDPAESVALLAKDYLSNRNLLNNSAQNKRPKTIFYTSGDAKKFSTLTSDILQANYDQKSFIRKQMC